MSPRKTPDSAPASSSLAEIATQFVLRLPSEDRPRAQQEVYKFVRWYGEDRQLSGLTIPEVANYAEQITSTTTEAAEKLGIIKTFLAYGYKQGLTRTNLAAHIKVKKTSPKPVSPSKRRSKGSVLLTTEGYADLEAQLALLRDERPRIAEDLRKAAADKDFRENAPLDAAREYQGQLEARIRELESTLKMATLMDEQQPGGGDVDIGDTVVLRDLVSGEELCYTLVDASEANPIEGKLSVTSPVGQALLGRQKGNKVEVRAPGGIAHYQIEDIKHR